MLPHIFSRWGNIGVLSREILGFIGVFCFPVSYNEFPHIPAVLPHFQGLRALFHISKITFPSDPAGIGVKGVATLIYKGWGGVLK